MKDTYVLELAAQKICDDLKILRKNITIKYRSKSSAVVKTVHGKTQCAAVIHSMGNSCYEVIMYTGGKTIYSLLRSLAHELRHAWQRDTGIWEYKHKLVYWKGKPLVDTQVYNEYADEVDANEYADLWQLDYLDIHSPLGTAKRMRLVKKV